MINHWQDCGWVRLRREEDKMLDTKTKNKTSLGRFEVKSHIDFPGNFTFEAPSIYDDVRIALNMIAIRDKNLLRLYEDSREGQKRAIYHILDTTVVLSEDLDKKTFLRTYNRDASKIKLTVDKLEEILS